MAPGGVAGSGGGQGGAGAPMMGESGRSAFAAWTRGVCSGLGRPVSRLVALTVGLERMVTTLRDGEDQEQAGLYDDLEGFLVLPGGAVRAKPVILGGRYRLVRLLGMGTFAQTVEAEDELSNAQPKQRFAVKVMKSGLQEIGKRESELLHMLRRAPGFSSANIVTARSSFTMGIFAPLPPLSPAGPSVTAQPLPPFHRRISHSACDTLTHYRQASTSASVWSSWPSPSRTTSEPSAPSPSQWA